MTRPVFHLSRLRKAHSHHHLQQTDGSRVTSMRLSFFVLYATHTRSDGIMRASYRLRWTIISLTPPFPLEWISWHHANSICQLKIRNSPPGNTPADLAARNISADPELDDSNPTKSANLSFPESPMSAPFPNPSPFESANTFYSFRTFRHHQYPYW